MKQYKKHSLREMRPDELQVLLQLYEVPFWQLLYYFPSIARQRLLKQISAITINDSFLTKSNVLSEVTEDNISEVLLRRKIPVDDDQIDEQKYQKLQDWLKLTESVDASDNDSLEELLFRAIPFSVDVLKKTKQSRY